MQHADGDAMWILGRRNSGLNLDPKTQTHVAVRVRILVFNVNWALRRRNRFIQTKGTRTTYTIRGCVTSPGHIGTHMGSHEHTQGATHCSVQSRNLPA